MAEDFTKARGSKMRQRAMRLLKHPRGIRYLGEGAYLVPSESGAGDHEVFIADPTVAHLREPGFTADACACKHHREIRDRYRNGRVCKHITAVGLWERARAVDAGTDDGVGLADERMRWANPPGYDAARAVERAGAEELIRCVVAGLFPAGHTILAEAKRAA